MAQETTPQGQLRGQMRVRKVVDDFDVQLLLGMVNGAVRDGRGYDNDDRMTWRLRLAEIVWWAKLKAKRTGLLLASKDASSLRGYAVFREEDPDVAVSRAVWNREPALNEAARPTASERIFYLVKRRYLHAYDSPGAPARRGGMQEESRMAELPPELKGARSEPDDRGIVFPGLTQGCVQDEIGFLYMGIDKLETAGVLTRIGCCLCCRHFFVGAHGHQRYCSPSCKESARPQASRDRAAYMREYRQLPAVKSRVTTRKRSTRAVRN